MRFLLMALAALGLALAGIPSAAKSPASPPQRPADRVFHISLQRTACFGTCPIYRVQIRSDGLVTYDGERFVAVTGHHTRRIPAAAVQRLRRQVVASGFMILPAESGQVGTDLPSQIIAVTLGGRSHAVTNYNPEGRTPPAFAGLAAAIDQTAGVARWVGPRPQRR